ncbi:hypothetical protein JCM10450v2_005771 [Rhodotorula kratochvilovae]
MHTALCPPRQLRRLLPSAPLAARAVDCSLVSPSRASDGHLEGLPLLQRKADSGKVMVFDSLARVRAALQKDVPKVFPKIEDERLRDLVVGKPNERIDPVFRKAYHPDVLEFLGDRIWNTVTVQTLLILAPRPSKEGGKTLVLGSLGSDISWLVSNDHGAELAKEFNVVHWSGSPCTAKSKVSLTSMGDAWEAHVGALLLANGRQAVLDFLVPLVKREFYKRHPQLLRLKTSSSAQPSAPAKMKQTAVSTSSKVAAAAKRPKQPSLPPSKPPSKSTARATVDPWFLPWREAFSQLGEGVETAPAGKATTCMPNGQVVGWRGLKKAPLVYPSHHEARARVLSDLKMRNVVYRVHKTPARTIFTLGGKEFKIRNKNLRQVILGQV